MKQRGMALLVVLLMVATMATVAVSTQEYWQRAFSRSEGQQFRQQAKWTLLGAEQWVRLQLLENLPADSVHPGQPWARPNQQFELDGVPINYQLRDNRACFNLNAMMPPRNTPAATKTEATTTAANAVTPSARQAKEPEASAYESLPLRIFRQLLTDQGLSRVQADTLSAALTARTPLVDISQLRILPGVDQALWQRLQPLVCVQPDRQLRININTLSGAAGAHLLVALSQGQLTHSQALKRLAARPPGGWSATAEITGSTEEKSAAAAFAELQGVAQLGSDDMELLLWTEQPPYRYELRSRLVRTEQGFRVTERRYGISD